MTEELPTTRLRELVEELRRALGGGRGWQTAAAGLLGVTPAYVSRLMNVEDSLRVGVDVMNRIEKLHGIPRAFFEDPDHAQGAAIYAALLVPQPGLLEQPDPRRPALDALARLIAAAETARADVLAGRYASPDAIAARAGEVLVELGAHRERFV